MACINPPALGEYQLLRYLDGDGDQSTINHLAACPHCRAQASSLENIQARLTARVYRRDCPSPQELGEYFIKLVPSDRRQFIATHIEICPHCVREMDELADYLKEPAPDQSVSPVSQLKILLARLSSDLLRPSGTVVTPTPAFSGLRGDTDASLRYEADNYEIALEVQTDAANPGKRILLGLVLGEGGPEMTASLYQAAEKVVTAPLDTLGNLILSGLNPGSYDLLFEGTGVEIHIPGIEI